ncbi:MAG: F0F1 ATP synthase subunit A [Muribaculaceae bacterium]|nr:F0F1 ATP synthase subunit A [Muribaculaceae bacterium]
MHAYRIPLPVIVKAEDGKWFCFSSGSLTKIEEQEHGGKTHAVSVPVIKTIERDGKSYSFVIAHISSHKDKLVQVFSLDAEQEAEVQKQVAEAKAQGPVKGGWPVVDGYVCVDGIYYREYRPLDISITKNVAALFISTAIVLIIVMSLVRYYRRRGLKAPRKGMGFMELLVSFVYEGTIKATLGENAKKFAPYLLTCFFFILIMNLLGLIVIFPGGANLTGNIAVTLVLAVMTFIVTNVFGSKHYWKEIFWPDVPIWLKCPLPIMQFIEIFGMFTKPAALCVRLFANMMGGHMIVITLTLLIFIFAAFGAAVAGATTVVSILFSLFMLALDVLVSFIQAYVFTTLSTIFIGMAVENHEHKHAEEHAGTEEGAEAAEAASKEHELLAREAATIDMKQ